MGIIKVRHVNEDDVEAVAKLPPEARAIIESDDFTIVEKTLGQMLFNLKSVAATGDLSQMGHDVLMLHFNAIAALLHPRPEKVKEFFHLFEHVTELMQQQILSDDAPKPTLN